MASHCGIQCRSVVGGWYCYKVNDLVYKDFFLLIKYMHNSYTKSDNSVVVATDSSEGDSSRSRYMALTKVFLWFQKSRTSRTVSTILSLSYPDINNPCSDLAKISPHILNPERFALHLATFLVSKYAHISKAFVTIEQLRWTRIFIKGDKPADDNGHPHSFFRDGNDKRVVKVEVRNLNRFSCWYFLTSSFV